MTDNLVIDEKIVLFGYINHRGDKSTRKVRPVRIWYGHTEWHPVDQWLLEAYDLDKQANRDFALTNIRDWREFRV